MVSIARFFLSIAAIISATLLFETPIVAQESLQPQPWIRVAIVTGVSSVTVRAASRVNVERLDDSGSVGSYDAGTSLVFQRSGSSVRLTGSGTSAEGFAVTCSDESGRLEVNRNSYRRTIRILVWNGALACVNVLPIEEYLWGVVPCEVPDTWQTEVLRAQAVAARTYSLRALEQYPDRPFDVYSTTVDQVYHGTSDESESTTEACKDTFGEVCTYNGTPIIAYYSAAAGGWTASSAEMFGRELPYLRPVPSRDASVFRWTYRVSPADLASALRGASYSVGTIQRVWVHRFSPEGRVDEVKIIHSGGVLLVGGVDLRRILGAANIKSTYFALGNQTAPDIPAEPSAQEAADSESVSSLHPSTLVPMKQERALFECSVITTVGIISLQSMVVLGADGSTRYSGGSIWVAGPGRAGDIATGSDRWGIFAFAGSRESLPPEGTVVDDPGAGVGGPTAGMFVFVGHGCGHGVGMSQHGARILAESGWAYRQILEYFYSGIEIERYW
jgi:stage II sporulation protein D